MEETMSKKPNETAEPEETECKEPCSCTEAETETMEGKAPARDFEAELSQMADQMMRLAAEYDNFRKRSQKEKDGIFADAVIKTVTELLPVLDDFERAMAVPCADTAYYNGILMVQKKLVNYLAKLGISEVPANGTFDPELHNAIQHVEDETLPANAITAVLQKGYRLGDRVIRHTLVTVAN